MGFLCEEWEVEDVLVTYCAVLLKISQEMGHVLSIFPLVL